MKGLLHVIGIALFTALSVFYVAFGVFYASVEDLLFFHAAAVPDYALEAVRPIYFALMKLIGGAAAALGLLGAYVTAVPVRRGDGRAAVALSAVYALPLAMAAIVAEQLAAATGAPTSWHIMGALMAVNIAALIATQIGSRRANAGVE